MLSQAQFIVGGARHLAMLPPGPAERLAWPSPFERGIENILARRGDPVCVLASGDPFLYGVGATLTAAIPAEEMICLPAPSSLSLAAARLGWALQECEIVSLHGRPFERIIPHLRPGARLLILSWDGDTPQALARLLTARGLGGSRFVVLEALGGPREAVTESVADQFERHDIAALNVVAVEIDAHAAAPFIPLTPGLPDEWFESNGQITKREIRAVTLSALAPWPGAVLWDVGAGSGSISIEWMLAHPRNRAFAIEANPDQADRIARNAAALGVPDLTVLRGRAPAALEGLPPPDAIFVGGGGAEAIDAAWDYLPRGRRLVVNAVTIETQNAVTERQARLGGSLTLIAVSRAEPIGTYRGWKPARPVVQWQAVKP